MVIEDLHTLTQRHRAKFFTFNDEAIFPAHLQSLSEAILASGIAIESTTDLRLDPQITPELAQMASDAGFKVFFFGLESGSDRVLAHMKKGADLATARQVFQNCSDAGVWNHAFVFFGFPTETLEEARATMDFVFENKDIIHSVGHSTFQLGRCSPAMKNPELFGITAIHKDSSSFMNLWANYSVASGLTMGQAEEVTREFADRVEKEYRSYFIWSRLAKDHILLYLSHYNTLKLSEVLEKFQDPEQPSHQGDLSETGFPELKSTVLCGLTKFDVARIMINMGTSEELAQNRDNLFIMYNFESGKTISVTLTAGLILGRCNGRRTIRDIAVELAELFQIPLEQATEDCKRIISAALEAGMCIQYQRYEF